LGGSWLEWFRQKIWWEEVEFCSAERGKFSRIEGETDQNFPTERHEVAGSHEGVPRVVAFAGIADEQSRLREELADAAGQFSSDTLH
jgi:hypothetical protein